MLLVKPASARGKMLRSGPMKSSSTRRVLKSVVGPALGATLTALVMGGCAKEEAKPTPTSTQPAGDTPSVPPQPEATKPPPATEPPVEPAKTETATPVEPETGGTPDAAPEPKKEVAPVKKKGAAKTAPKKEAAPPAEDKQDEPKKSPSTEWYAGTFLDRDIRPMRPARRGTDATVHALLTGLHDPALRPLS